jgi:hypothetical protein
MVLMAIATNEFALERQGRTLLVTVRMDLRELEYPKLEAGARDILHLLRNGTIKNMVRLPHDGLLRLNGAGVLHQAVEKNPGTRRAHGVLRRVRPRARDPQGYQAGWLMAHL